MRAAAAKPETPNTFTIATCFLPGGTIDEARPDRGSGSLDVRRCRCRCAEFHDGNAVENADRLEQKTPSVKTIAEKTTGMQKLPGFFTYYWDAREGKVWLQIDKWDVPFLYYESLPNGVGSNDVGLDRGQPGRTSVVHFERIGPRVLLVAENERYRAVTDDLEQRTAVEQSFAQSVLWGFEVAAEDKDGEAVLVDATPFFLSDAHEVAARLAAGQARRLPRRFVAVGDLPSRTKNFPENTDVESTLTLVGDNPGPWVEQVTP